MNPIAQRLFSVFLSAFLLACLSRAQAENWNNTLSYSATAAAPYTATITGYIGSPTTIDIPAQITNGSITYEVVAINQCAFSDCGSLTGVTIPNSVSYIGGSAFSDCSSLTSVTIPNSVTYIGDFLFSGCSSLTSVTISDGITSIGYRAFDGCSSLTSITIPDSVTSIDRLAFFGCNSLTSITIPNSVTFIGEGAFAWCIALTSITIPDSVTSIESDAFGEGSRLQSILVSENNNNFSSIDGVLFNKYGTILLRYPAGKSNLSYAIPDSVTSVGYGAFTDCRALTSITIPNSVTSVDDSAFIECTGLTSITLPNSVTSIGPRAFAACNGLVSITIPDSVTSIGEYAFYQCFSLTNVTIPCGVTSIGEGAFSQCYGMTQARFLGNAPTLEPTTYRKAFDFVAPGFTIYYDPSATGFTTPTWNGYNTSPTLVSNSGWRQRSFTPAELTDAAISGPNADPDGDGLSNLLEMALNCNPKVADSPASPTLPHTEVAEDGALTFAFEQAAVAPELDIVPEVSTDLVTWNSGAGYLSTLTDTTSGTVRSVVVKSLLPPSTTPRQYIRLRVVGR